MARLGILALLGSTLGCTTTVEAVFPDSTSTQASSTAAFEVSSGTGEATGEDSTGSSTASSEPMPVGPFAAGIRLTRVTANQGVRVVLVDHGEQTEFELRSARLIQGRNTLMRGFWSLHSGFEARELVGRLILDYPDGRELVLDSIVEVKGDSADAGASFQWLVPADDVVAGIRFRAKILELPDVTDAGDVSDPPPIAPLDGRGDLALFEPPAELEVVLVPVQHQFGDCELAPEITEDDLEALRQALYAQNPVQLVDLTVHDPMPYAASIGESEDGFVSILGELAQLRAADAPEDDVFYYGLLDSCDGYPPGLAGQAMAIVEPLRENAFQRVATGRWRGSGAAAADTFVHEIGHTLGRRHVRCSGGEAGIDGDYPHPGGRIGVWGLGLFDRTLRTPSSTYDYMSYCANSWVSDYGWERNLDAIEVLTGWDFALPSSDERDAIVVGMLGGERPRWFATRGTVPPHGRPVEVSARIGIDTLRLEASVYGLVDGPGEYVVARLPEQPWDQLQVRVEPGPMRVVSADEVGPFPLRAR